MAKNSKPVKLTIAIPEIKAPDIAIGIPDSKTGDDLIESDTIQKRSRKRDLSLNVSETELKKEIEELKIYLKKIKNQTEEKSQENTKKKIPSHFRFNENDIGKRITKLEEELELDKKFISICKNKTELFACLFLDNRYVLPNFRDENGFSPLHYACKNDYKNLVNKLLSYKANPNIKNNDGQAPIDIAINSEVINFEIIYLLKKYKADFNNISNPREDIEFLDLSRYRDEVKTSILPILKNIFPNLVNVKLDQETEVLIDAKEGDIKPSSIIKNPAIPEKGIEISCHSKQLCQ